MRIAHFKYSYSLTVAFVFMTSGLSAAADSVASPLRKHHEISSFSVFFKEVKKVANLCGEKPMIVAFDLDNTLMEMDEDLASEQWFDWQAQVITTEKGDSREKMADSFGDLLKLDTQLKQRIGMHLSEKLIARRFRKMAEEKNVLTLILSSRPPQQSDVTVRELTKNKLDFARSTLPSMGKDAYLPFDPKNLESSGFSAAEGEAMKLQKPRAVSFDQGVYATAGQHKGAMLRSLLHRFDVTPCGVAFVDNKPQYSEQVTEAFAASDAHILTFRYSRTDGHFARFKKLDKSTLIERAKAMLE
jgi:hypothetical protein